MTTTDIKQVEADALEQIVRADEDFFELYEELKTVRDNIKKLKNAEDAAKELIREYMIEKYAKKITFDGKDLAVLTKTSSRSFDYKLAEAELGVDVVAKYVTKKNTTRLDIK